MLAAENLLRAILVFFLLGIVKYLADQTAFRTANIRPSLHVDLWNIRNRDNLQQQALSYDWYAHVFAPMFLSESVG